MMHRTACAALLFAAALAPGTAAAQAYINLTVDGAVQIALNRNEDISNAREETVRSGLRVMEATSMAFPHLNGFWDYQRVIKPMVFIIEFPDPTTGRMKKNRLTAGTDHSMNVGASLQQNIWLGGKVGTGLKAARIYRNMTANTLTAVEENIVAGTMQAFNGALLSAEMVGITREALAQAERHMENVRTMSGAGVATEYDLLRARVQVSNMRPQVLDAERQLNNALLALKDVMGVDPNAPITLEGELAEPDTSLFTRATEEIATSNRADLRASRDMVDLQEKNVKIVRSDMLPSLTAGTTFQYMGNFDTFKYEADTWRPYWFAQVNLSFPIFTGMQNYSRFQQAKVDHRIAQTEYRNARNGVLIEVEENVMSLRNAMAAIESQRLTVQEAERATELAESRFRAGAATQLEVLDAQLALEQARTNMVNALYQGVTAEIQLRRSLGLIDVPGKGGQ